MTLGQAIATAVADLQKRIREGASRFSVKASVKVTAGAKGGGDQGGDSLDAARLVHDQQTAGEVVSEKLGQPHPRRVRHFSPGTGMIHLADAEYCREGRIQALKIRCLLPNQKLYLWKQRGEAERRIGGNRINTFK